MSENSVTIEFFKKYGKCIKPSKTIQTNEFNRFPPIICNDGTFISVQAGENYHCYPGENLENFEYETVEVYRNEDVESEETLNLFVCEYDKYILSHVPVEILDDVILKHGGLAFDKIDTYINEN